VKFLRTRGTTAEESTYSLAKAASMVEDERRVRIPTAE
jgi:hypothetical protein